MKSYDIAIIGAGPSGMQAAITASSYEASVVVIHDKATAGGQIYRNVSDSSLPDIKALGTDYLKGQTLVEQFVQCSAEVIYNASAWHVGDDGEVLFSMNNQTHRLQAKEIIVATGAMERPFPVTGWHLPGVMSAGSAQVMLKTDGLVKDHAVFVGSGPLLYVIVAQYLRLGVKVDAVVDTTPKAHYLQAGVRITDSLSQLDMIFKGLGLLNEIRRSGTPFYRFADKLSISGENKAQSLQFYQGTKRVELSVQHLFLHQGVIPNLNLTRALGVEHEWCEQQLCWKPRIDGWGQSSIHNISVVGDGRGIVGADGAEQNGVITALNLLCRLQRVSVTERDRLAKEPIARLERLNRFRRFIDVLYRPAEQNRIPTDDDVVVCRCEERTVAHLRIGFQQGAIEPNALKGITRCGMGPCQGRQCGHTVSELLAKWQQKSVSDIGYYRLRSPMRLLTLEELSHFHQREPQSLPLTHNSNDQDSSYEG